MDSYTPTEISNKFTPYFNDVALPTYDAYYGIYSNTVRVSYGAVQRSIYGSTAKPTYFWTTAFNTDKVYSAYVSAGTTALSGLSLQHYTYAADGTWASPETETTTFAGLKENYTQYGIRDASATGDVRMEYWGYQFGNMTANVTIDAVSFSRTGSSEMTGYALYNGGEMTATVSSFSDYNYLVYNEADPEAYWVYSKNTLPYEHFVPLENRTFDSPLAHIYPKTKYAESV